MVQVSSAKSVKELTDVIVNKIKNPNNCDRSVEELMYRELRHFESILKRHFQSQNVGMCTCHTTHVDSAVAIISPAICEAIESIDGALRRSDRDVSEDVYRKIKELLFYCR
jgi:hypothetical protein